MSTRVASAAAPDANGRSRGPEHRGGGGQGGRDPRFETEALACLNGLYRTAVRLTGSPADAEDLVQDTYVRAFRAANTFEPGSNLRAWLFTILHNAARNRARDRSRDALTVDTDALERAGDTLAAATSETPESALIRQTLSPELQAAIDALPAVFREAVWLRDVEEFSYADIARMLDVPPGTVMSRISRGRRMLFERMAGREPGRLAEGRTHG